MFKKWSQAQGKSLGSGLYNGTFKWENLWGQACTMVLSNVGAQAWLRYNLKVPLYKPDPKDFPLVT
jgi:hypothetical protein